MKLLFENKRYILSIFLTILMVFGTLMSGYADENSAPVFIDGNRAIRTIAENTPAGVNIGEPVAATDADNDTLTYSKGWVDGIAFSIDAATGQIRTKAPLDYETKNVYSFSVFANDGNGGGDFILVTINVTDVDETPANNTLTFTEGPRTTRTVAENTAAGTNIGTAIAATDADGDTLTYTLGGTDASAFSIISTSGQLQTKAALDYETDASYAVTVSVSDGNGGSDSIEVTISVTDVNETPSFPTETATRTIAENTAAGQAFGDPFQATDPDTGDTLTYSLHRGDRYSFRIDSTTGQLRTHAALNFETKKVYNDLAIRATDSNGKFDAIFVTVNVTDVNETPSFPTETATRTIAENTASGEAFGDPFQATDPDTGDTLTYSLHRGDAGVFRINPTTGQLRTHRALDFETKKVYNDLAIRATDSNGNFDAIFVTISVTDVTENSAPVFSDGDSTTRVVAENTASGENIGTVVAATDADNDTLTYNLSGDDASAFSIISTSGQLQTRAALDYETKSSYAVTVTASDGSLTDSIRVTITATDVNETPSFPTETATRTIAENTAAGQAFGDPFQATDPDNGDTVTYSLHRGDAGVFRINPITGQLRTHRALDFETKKVYDNLAIRATDSNGKFDAIFVTITVTNVNETPSFTDGSSTTRAIAENTAAGVNIGSAVAATDADDDTLTYALGGTDAASFSIVSTSGQLQTKAALDYETDASYAVTVSVSDDNGESDSIEVTITATDVNEKPSFGISGRVIRAVAENTAAGQAFGAPFQATDPDSGDTLTYSLHRGDAAAFRIDPNTGQLRTYAPLDFETKNAYTNLAVRATDRQGLINSVLVTINVTDVHENSAPAFTDGTSTTRSVTENTASGTDIGAAIAATDPDTGDTLTYSLGGTDADAFSIVSTSGQLQTKSHLDYEIQPSYAVSVSVSDGNGGSDSITVTINVTEIRVIDNRTLAVSDAIVDEAGVRRPYQVTPAHLARIERLDVSAKSIDALKAGDFAGLTNLKTLNLRDNSISDLSELRGLTNLEYLNLGYNSISDLSPLSGLTKLKALSMSGNNISNLSPLRGLTNLTSLYMNNNSISDLSPLSNLTNLVTLSLPENSISDLSPLSSLTNLRYLYLDENNISDLSPLSNLTSLTHLALVETSISDLSPLSNLTNLVYLHLGGTSLSDLSPLSSLNLSNFFYLDGTSVSDISVLSNWTEMRRLVLRNNENLSDLSPLSSLTSLRHLDLNNNAISDISPLIGLTSLIYLDLRNNSISDFSPIHRLKVAIGVTRSRLGLWLDIEEIPEVSNDNVPAFTDGDSTTRSIAENADSGTNIGTAVSATDTDAEDILTYHLGGTDADAFSIVRASGQLQTKAELDHETKNSYTVAIAVSDGKGGSDTITVTINVTDVAGAAPSVETPPVLPETTVLLSNFPNPFNPETWIPYQLAEPAEVTLTIYDVRGSVVRTLLLGNQPAGLYRSRSKAAHWDGRNQFGEKVATGIYFYTLKAGDYIATRKLLIRK